MSDIKIQPSATGSATVTLTAPATSTARTVTLPDGTGTIIADNGSGSVGIGTSSPARPLEVKDSSDQANIRLQGSVGYCDLSGNGGNGSDFVVLTEGTEKFRVKETGGIRATDGILFGSDTAAANTLDDYEEGTHVVTATMTSSGSVTLNRDTMSYTKDGRLVTCTGEIDISTTSSPSGAMKWTLPFAIANNSLDRDAYIGFKPVCYHVPFSGGIPPVALGNSSAAHIIFVYEQHDAANASYVPYAGDAFNFTFSYITN